MNGIWVAVNARTLDVDKTISTTPTVGADQASIIARVRDTAGNLDNENLTVEVTNCVSGCTTVGDPGESISVHVDYEYHLITPVSSLLGLISGGDLGPTLTFDATSEMRLE